LKNQRTANPGSFKTIAVFIKEPVKNQWFSGPVLVSNWAFDFFLTAVINHKNHPDNLRGLTYPINLASSDQCCPDMKI
jgi:hypothetical protein